MNIMNILIPDLNSKEYSVFIGDISSVHNISALRFVSINNTVKCVDYTVEIQTINCDYFSDDGNTNYTFRPKAGFIFKKIDEQKFKNNNFFERQISLDVE